MKYLIAIDCDGTLSHSDGTISSDTINTINNLILKNQIVVICTERPRYHTIKISKEVGASKYIISSNGSEIYDYKENKIIWASYINSNDCSNLYNYAKKENIRIIFVLENTEYVTEFTRNNNQTLLTDENLNDLLVGKVKQITINDKDKQKINDFKNIINNDYKLNIIDSSDNLKEEIWFSIISNDASKGIALLKLSEYLKINKENIIAIGNDNNDISMFKVAGISAVVNNGSKDAINSAKVIIDSNDEDGVSK